MDAEYGNYTPISDKIQRIIVETDEESPVTVAEITFDSVKAASGYRVRITPRYD